MLPSIEELGSCPGSQLSLQLFKELCLVLPIYPGNVLVILIFLMGLKTSFCLIFKFKLLNNNREVIKWKTCFSDGVAG